ncbi:caspase family protein [Dyadobacter diqingensis]|uniref:caspase family protein n=1 Tax=Dyadobacter diqingensis TaxID=2938121 RepID=UPI0020C1918A|nr:caspase family protein [Dyadobacter diqingensis]
MILNSDTPGLWTNPNWEPGTPGTFALLIGVSRYDHLAGGNGPLADKNYGLGQLAVSAWTTYALFEWLRTSYVFDGAPLAQCWLLLSPTAEEKDKIKAAIDINGGPDVLDSNQQGTYSQIEEAVSFWNSTMAKLPKTAAKQSRSFFFFSGHGLEIHLREQILLPSDYLRLPGTYDRALNIRRLSDAMARLPVCDQFFFVDACRNTHPDLAKLEIRGNGILTIAGTDIINPACNSAILYATATGMPAHQYGSPGRGYSLFGQALLDGLQSQAGFIPSCSPEFCSVQLSILHRFLRERYNQLLVAAVKQPVEQYIKLGSEPLNLDSIITIVPTPIGNGQMRGETDKPKGQPLHHFSDTFELGTHKESHRQNPNFVVNRHIRHQAGESQKLEKFYVANLEELVGASSVAAFWHGTKLYPLNAQQEIDKSALSLLKVERSAMSKVSMAYRLTFSVHLPYGCYWIRFTDETSDFWASLTASFNPQEEVPFYRLEFSIDSHHHITNLKINLANEGEGKLARVARLWEKYLNADVLAAAKMIDMKFFHKTLKDKSESPLAAVIAATVLLKARRFDLAKGDWLTNLANWFPNIADGPILRNQWLSQQKPNMDRQNEMIFNLTELLYRGLPSTSEAFSLAVLQVDRLLESGALKSSHKTDKLREVASLLHESLPYFSSGGLLTVFSGPKGESWSAKFGNR